MIRLIQLMCPERHCLLAFAYDADDMNPKQAADSMRETLRYLREQPAAFIPECGICKSLELHTEDGETAWDTIEEARPHLQQMEIEQLEARLILRAREKATRN